MPTTPAPTQLQRDQHKAATAAHTAAHELAARLLQAGLDDLMYDTVVVPFLEETQLELTAAQEPFLAYLDTAVPAFAVCCIVAPASHAA